MRTQIARGIIASLLIAGSAGAQTITDLQIPADSTPGTARYQGAVPKAGEVRLILRLPQAPLIGALGRNARRTGIRWSAAQQRAYLQTLKTNQDAVLAQARALGARELGRVSKAHNAVMISIDASKVKDLSKVTGVSKIRPLLDYRYALSNALPYLGAAAAQAAGATGAGVTIAILDSGVDYTHKNLGGTGTAAAYLAAYGADPSSPQNKSRDGLFPTAKVIEGFDFVGEAWPSGPVQFDDDPIDYEGHGTHVADIAAGLSQDGTHKGIAPDAKILAVKVCSAVATACNGLSILYGLDYAVDPNGDGDVSDAAYVINLSLGSSYGQREDDSSEVCTLLSAFGIVVVSAAGNEGDRPFILSSAASAPAVIAVAETQAPGTLGYPVVINSPAAIAASYPNTATLDFAPVGLGWSGQVVFVGRGCPAGSIDGANPDDPYLANPAGKVALIDRGACNISEKVDRAAKAGAIGVLIGLTSAGNAVSFSYGGGTVFVPSLVIQQSLANAIKSQVANNVVATLNPAGAIPLQGSMVSASSRGPGYSYYSLKPDIGAPGALLSAEVGTATGQTVFGGTSGATPVVTGSAALLVQTCPSCYPEDIKARLMNSAETNIYTSPQIAPGELAPLTRIGGGEVRPDKARLLTAWAWDSGDPAAVSLSFGHYRATGTQTRQKKVLVKNLSASTRVFQITPQFRYANDAASGAVTISAPGSVTVPGFSNATFVVSLTLNANLLNAWNLNGGSSGGNGALLQGQEYDGYIKISDASDTLTLPWHLLAHKSANITPSTTNVALNGGVSASFNLTNPGGAVNGRSDSFALLGTSPKYSGAVLPRPGDNFAVVDLRAAGARLVNAGGGQLGLQFGITTWGERAHPAYPAEFDIFLDVDNDGTDDYVAFTSENGGFGLTGQTLVSLYRFSDGAQVTRFFSDADLGSANSIATILLSDLGINSSTKITAWACAGDNYFTGLLTDCIGPMTFTPDTLKYTLGGLPAAVVPGGSAAVTVNRNVAGDAASPSQTGILLLHRDAKIGREADLISVSN